MLSKTGIVDWIGDLGRPAFCSVDKYSEVGATASGRESPSAHALIGHASDFTMQCNSHAEGLHLAMIRSALPGDVAVLQHFSPGFSGSGAKLGSAIDSGRPSVTS